MVMAVSRDSLAERSVSPIDLGRSCTDSSDMRTPARKQIWSVARQLVALIVFGILGAALRYIDIWPATYVPGTWMWFLILLTPVTVVLWIRIRKGGMNLWRRLGVLSVLAVAIWAWSCIVLGMTGWDSRLTRTPSDDVTRWERSAAQRISRLDAYNPRDREFLRALVADRRIVLLGESSHCVEEYSQLKLNIIRFLHEELGFNVLAFESYMLPAYLANLELAAKGHSNIAIDCLYPMWKTETVRRLFRYIEATKSGDSPMHLAGIDMKIKQDGWSEVMAFIYGALASDSTLAGDYMRAQVRFGPDIYDRIRRRDIDESDPLGREFATFYTGLSRHLGEASEQGVMTGESARDRDLAAQLAGNVAAQPRYQGMSGFRRVALRDSLMARNVEYLAEKLYPKEKIIVWAHNSHIARARSEAELSDMPMRVFDWLARHWRRVTFMGEHLSNKYGDDLYVVGLYMASGTYETIRGDKQRVRPPRRDSVEYLMHDASVAATFLDFTNTSEPIGHAWQSRQSKVLYESSWYAVVPAEQYDAIAVVSRANPPQD